MLVICMIEAHNTTEALIVVGKSTDYMLGLWLFALRNWGPKCIYIIIFDQEGIGPMLQYKHKKMEKKCIPIKYGSAVLQQMHAVYANVIGFYFQRRVGSVTHYAEGSIQLMLKPDKTAHSAYIWLLSG